MIDYFLEEWDEEPPQEPDPYEWWLNNTVEGLKEALRLMREGCDNKIALTNGVLRTMQINNEHKAKLQALGYLEDLVF